MDNDNFRKELHRAADWVADYFERIESYPVKSQVAPGSIFSQLNELDCRKKSSMDEIFSDFEKIIIPGITHWQSPNFFAYFPANSSYPSVIAELLTSALAAQCMVWETSPAAAELEEYMMNMLRDLIGLPPNFHGVIQDTASTATLVSLLVAREKYSSFQINADGFDNQKFRIYCSSEAHSSIEKAVKIAGFGSNNLVKIPVDDRFAMISELLREAIESDLDAGFVPLAVVSAFGTTGSTAIDPIIEISKIAKEYSLFHHVDAALAGTALILPELRYLAEGIEYADSLVFNPHKWMFTNFDCSAYFIKDKDALTRTFSILPEYLKTKQDSLVNNYRDWGIQLGRRFRALKLWFVVREYGVEGIQAKIREHLELTKFFADKLLALNIFEIMAPYPFNTVCFRLNPKIDSNELDILNEQLLTKLNSTGKLFLSHTKLNGQYVLRFVVGQTHTELKHVLAAIELIHQISDQLLEDSIF